MHFVRTYKCKSFLMCGTRRVDRNSAISMPTLQPNLQSNHNPFRDRQRERVREKDKTKNIKKEVDNF